MINAPDYSAFI